MKFIASTTMGLESVVKKECVELGFKNIKVDNGRVEFEGDFRTLAKANINIRCADRIFLKMGEFKALTYEELFQEVKKIEWQNILPDDAEFPISWVSSVKCKLYSKSDIQKIVKKAIVEKLKIHYKKDFFEENGAKYKIKVQGNKDIFAIMIDTSGDALNIRGYRKLHNSAPIKETMAAALVKLSGWKKNIALFDPMCGSGTILIEAAMMAKNIAPGSNRKFAAEEWKVIDKNIWIDERDEAYSKEIEEINLNIFGSDIDEEAIKIAKKNSKNAGVEDCINFDVKDVKDTKIDKETKDVYIITNPPYGERLISENEIEAFYSSLGKKFKKDFKVANYFIITSYEDFEKVFGIKSNKNRKLYNGGIKCYFYQYYGDKK